jgi:hypothetical protein
MLRSAPDVGDVGNKCFLFFCGAAHTTERLACQVRVGHTVERARIQRNCSAVFAAPDVDIEELKAYGECDFGKRKAGPAWVHVRGGFHEPTSPKKGMAAVPSWRRITLLELAMASIRSRGAELSASGCEQNAAAIPECETRNQC